MPQFITRCSCRELRRSTPGPSTVLPSSSTADALRHWAPQPHYPRHIPKPNGLTREVRPYRRA